MTTYNTRNPLGSAAAKDLYDNAQNLDFAVNDITKVIWSDRFGRNRKTFWGMEQDFATQLLTQEQRFNIFIQNSGYKVIGDYADGPLTITEYNQLIRYDGELWKITAATDVPFTTTGTDATSWANDSTHFVSVGDAALRQELVSNRILSTSPNFYGAIGDGVSNDTTAFESMESLIKGIEIDLRGMSYAVDNPFSKNKYNNGYFIIGGVKHPSSLEVNKLKLKKFCATFLTGDPSISGEDVIFPGAAGTFQGACLVNINGILKLYVTNRSDVADPLVPSYGNFLKGETYRIVEYSFNEDGGNLVATEFSQPLNTIGHATMLNYRIEGGELYFYSGSPNESTTDTTAGGKGFSKIKWNGSETSNADVTNYTLFDQSNVSGAVYGNLSKSNAAVSSNGEYLCIIADDDLRGGYVTLIYNLDELLNSSDPKSVLPISEFVFPAYRGYTFQGVTLDSHNIIVYYDAPTDDSVIKVFDFSGNNISTIDGIQFFKSMYSQSDYMGGAGVPLTMECESVFAYAGDLYVGIREIWNSLGVVVSYNGKFYTPRATTTGNSPASLSYWWEVNDNGTSTVYSPTTTYTVTGSRVKNKKHIFKITSLAQAGSESLRGSQQLHSPPYLTDPNVYYSGDAGNFGWRCWLENLKKWLYTLHVSSTGNFRFYDTSNDSQGNTAFMISLFDKLVGTNRTHYARLRGGDGDGGNILLYSSDDSTRPGGISEYVGPASSVSRETDQYGQTYFKTNTANNVPLRADVNGTFDAQRWSRNGTIYAGLRVSTTNTILTSRNGNSFVMGASSSVDGVTTDTTARININLTDMALRADTNNNLSLGKAAYLWTTGYFASGISTTSDERLKTDIVDINDAEKAVAMKCKAAIKRYKYTESVAAKGDENARYHFGIVAQNLISIFTEGGLDASDYGILIHETWEDQYEPVIGTREVVNEQGETVQEDYETGETKLVLAAGDRYSIRYEELLCFIMASL